jgi:hypothetical protein
MIPVGVRGNKKGKEGQFNLMKEIRVLLPFRKDREIMKILGVPNSTFYRYKSMIYKEDKELWSKAMFEPLESRALRIYETLHESLRISKQIASNDKNKPRDRMRASRKMVNDQYNILYLLRMGPNWYGYHNYF